MPYIDINGFTCFYESYGSDRPGRAPVVLIHGSTGTGRSNWMQVAPRLAKEYRVIVPDSRGHGRSSNPNHSYSFKELADDTAALVHALGYERAHIIGHSNGGNVALVTLLEHPEIVQTAIPQAANAWVSPDLPEIEPGKFDPDRVARENPAWMQEMIELHAPTHGQEYWRELLQITVKEIISQPNYTPQDLAKVQRPTLVIQGEKDQVNAPYRHAQFIALHIPEAELWVPKGIGHTVQDEVLSEWLKRVLDFLDRRGNDTSDALFRLGRSRYPDRREHIFDIRTSADVPASTDSSLEPVELTGKVLTAEHQRTALESLVGRPVVDHLQVLIGEDTPWALIKRGVTDVRRGTDISTERMTQALFGESVRIIEEEGDWAYVRMERDGYLGWLQVNALHRCSRSEVEAYQRSGSHLVLADISPLSLRSGERPGHEGLRLPFGVSVSVIACRDGQAQICLPDGSQAWLPEKDLLPVSERPSMDSGGIAYTLGLIRRFIGVPYLWGGRTPFGFDCSGFAQAFLHFMGGKIRRDADQQYLDGSPVVGEFEPGDLLFFGSPREDEPEQFSEAVRVRRISHAGVSLGGDEFIHSNGSAWGVSINSFDPGSPLYRPWLKENCLGARRFRA